MTAGHRVHLKGGEDVDPDEAGAGATVGGKDTPRVTLQRGDPTADGPAGEPAGPAAPRALARTHAHVHTHRLPGASLPHTRAVLGEEGPVLRPEPCAVGPCGQDLSLGGAGAAGGQPACRRAACLGLGLGKPPARPCCGPRWTRPSAGRQEVGRRLPPATGGLALGLLTPGL